jgi:hypothetical protein
MSAPHPRLRDRLAAHLRAQALDTELARGAPPDSTPALAQRATIRRRAADPDADRAVGWFEIVALDVIAGEDAAEQGGFRSS